MVSMPIVAIKCDYPFPPSCPPINARVPSVFELRAAMQFRHPRISSQTWTRDAEAAALLRSRLPIDPVPWEEFMVAVHSWAAACCSAAVYHGVINPGGQQPDNGGGSLSPCR